MYLESLQPGAIVDEDSATCSTSAAHGPVLRYQVSFRRALGIT